ncbi:hypothetical protein ACUOFC_52735, partial [Escherichia sp. TWPC-MK]
SFRPLTAPAIIPIEEQGNVVSRFGLKLVYGSTLVSVLSASIAALVL